MSEEQVNQEPSVQTNEMASAPTEGGFSVPQEYSDRGWASKFSSYDDVFKAYDNAQSLIGKRPEGIPAKDAPEEEWEKFYTALGKPETPDAYELSLEGVEIPEGVDFSPLEDKAKGFFHKLGLSPEKANQAWRDYVAIELETMGDLQASEAERTKQLDEHYDKFTAEIFGDRKAQIEEKALAAYNEALSDERFTGVRDAIGNNPEVLSGVLKLSDHYETKIQELSAQLADVKKKYGAEDSLKSGVQPQPMSQQDLVLKLMEARKKASTSDPFSPERKAAEEEMKTLREQLAKFNK